jgi:hypothetical protein
MLPSLDDVPNFDQTRPTTTLAARSSTAHAFRPWVGAPRTIYDALREALVACRQYRRLRSLSISHDTALRQALGNGVSLHECRKKRRSRDAITNPLSGSASASNSIC